MNKKVVMATLAVCLILGVGILAVYAWAPGVNASADFDHPRWAVWTSKHRAKATFDASHAIAPFVIPHGHTGTWYTWAEINGTHDTPYAGNVTLTVWPGTIGTFVRQGWTAVVWDHLRTSGCAIAHVSLDAGAHADFDSDHSP